MALIDDIRRQARRESEVVDLATSGFEDELARVLANLNTRIRRLVRRLDSSDGRLVATRQSLGRAVRLRLEIATILEEAGFQDLVEESLSDPIDRLTARVLDGRRITGRAARLTPIDVEALSAWREIRTADLLQIGDDLATAVWRSTVDGVIGSRDPVALVDEIASITEVSARQARTVYDTAVSTYSRQVDQLGVDPRPEDRFLYVGPSDTATRPFCARFVGQVKTRAELDSIDNGQIPNTLLTGGGWNCRHKWLFLADVEPSEVAA